MNKHILNIEVQEFINLNLDNDPTSIILKGSPFSEVSSKELANQIICKNKCKKKLPTWFANANIYYPDKLNIEQTSSEATAKYKSSLLVGSTLIDLTGGFGVDSYYFSKHFSQVIHCEINQELHEIVKYNYNVLNVSNIKAVNNDGLDYLKTIESCDWLYIDPSRRHDTKGKVFFLKDCLPNVPKHLDFLLSKSSNILVKTSPLLDIKAGLNELKFVKEIHCVAVNNDVKELLWIIKKDFNEEIMLKAINIKAKSTEIFESNFRAESNANSDYSKPLSYLYEPNSAIMKLGLFNSITETFKVNKLDINSHLYTSENYIKPFPGRQFKIMQILPYNKKSMKFFSQRKANVSTRNFPLTVKEIKKNFKLIDGGNTYLFFTTSMNEKIVIITQKV